MKHGNYFNEPLFVTAGKVLTIQQAEKQIKDRVSPKNFQILLSRLTSKSSAEKVIGFSEQKGLLYFYTLDGFIVGDQDIENQKNIF